ncbi:MAG TPA: HDIG domain-containing protein [Clostridia bacterium]|nr:HDIG domain-containing protein [Clostridia bacterium]
MADNKASNKGNAFKRVWATLSARRKLWGVIFFICIVILLSADFLPERINIQVGDVSDRQIKAPQGTVFISDVLTNRARQEAADQVDSIFKIDQDVLLETDESISEIYQKILTVNADDSLNETQKTSAIQAQINTGLPSSTLKAVANAEPDVISNLSKQTKQFIREYMEKGVQEKALESTKQDILLNVKESDLEEDFKPLVTAVISETELKPNLVLDEERMEASRQEAMSRIQPVQVTVKQGEEIVGDGQVVTEEKYEILEHLGLLKTSYRHFSFLGLICFVVLVIVLILIYLYRYNREILLDEKKFLLLGLLITAGLFIDRGIISIKLGDNPEIASLIGYMVPTAAVSMLTAVLLDRKLAIFVSAVMSIFVGLMMGNQLEFAALSFIGGTVGVFSVSDISERTDVTRASIYIVLANVVAVTGLVLIKTNSFSLSSLGAVVGLINGILSAILTIGSLPFLENAFGITTSIKLLELSNPNQPLLRRLLVEAPGTYHHSMMVANLAEGAAEAIGANQLLTRVGAYYHDIGKLKRPYFFIENQISTENPHDKLTPTLSTLVITSHVKEGAELAAENGIPQVITDILCQHHGTTLVSYFYHKACDAEKEDCISESAFRYEGKKPQTKEAAIVMLADSVEAAVRSLKYSGHGRLEAQVRKIVNDRLEDGQLEESELTFKELEIITRTFVRILSGIFHSRIEYPDNLLQEIEGRKRNGDNDNQRAAEV